MNKNISAKFILLLLILFLAITLGIINGSSQFSFSELMLQQNRHILGLRLSRIVMSAVAGMGLAVSGIALQAILRNPLAEPYLLGTSSGAGLGAVLAIICGAQALNLTFAAFLGSALTIFLVYNIARRGNKVPVQSLILSGVIISIAFSGLIAFLISLSGNEALHGAMWWLWGSTQVYNLNFLFIISIVVAAGIVLIFFLAQDLNAISIGEEEALHLGINTERLKKMLFLITSLITAALVSICGIIGFVGLIIPHMLRFAVGPNHKILIPAACIAAAAFMILCDMFSRTLFSPLEIPIGVITALIGTPIFIILLKHKQKVN